MCFTSTHNNYLPEDAVSCTLNLTARLAGSSAYVLNRLDRSAKATSDALAPRTCLRGLVSIDANTQRLLFHVEAGSVSETPAYRCSTVLKIDKRVAIAPNCLASLGLAGTPLHVPTGNYPAIRIGDYFLLSLPLCLGDASALSTSTKTPRCRKVISSAA